ncbi:MAG TPA: DNA translocase FtsK 4TM domain-containing protein [Tissierellaceae bacterium]|nr:DNA translocase FtsK 4TM domain-containing protein [Tissierellaceae bacterium]
MAKNKKSAKTKRKRKKNISTYNLDIIGIGIILLGLIIGISLFDFNMGIIGSIFKNGSFLLMGFGAYMFPIILIIIGLILVIDKFQKREMKIIIYVLLIFLSVLIILDGVNSLDYTFTYRIKKSIELSSIGKGGGTIGSLFGFSFYHLFGSVGTYLILSFVILINILLITNIKIKELFLLLKKEFIDKMKPLFKSKKTKESLNKEAHKVISRQDDITILDYRQPEITDYPKVLELPKKSNVKKEIENIEEEIKNRSNIYKYNIPSISLLNSPNNDKNIDDEREIRKNAKIIKETMRNFGIDAQLIQINKGPTVTCYELKPAPGIKLSKIVSLSDNIALSLASSDIRIEAPIPGKAAVGIEVPNRIKSNVLLKELILSKEYKELESVIPLALGKDVSGKVVVSTIDKMPHLLIAGATGSGKSVCINTIIMNIIYRSSPEEVKLLLIDPKVVELNVYNGIPHLLIPVVTDAKKASFALNWAVEEMEKRYKLFAKNNVRDINSFNEKFENDKDKKLPMIIIIIDELADLMMVAAQEIEEYISRLAQMARAAGMYLIVATQRPSVDVITGTIKANIPSRISFAVSSNVDSRTILDMGGAEKLLGKGDMLFYPSFYVKPKRIQGAFISNREIENIVNSLKEDHTTEYDEEAIEIIESNKNTDFENSDELIPDAISIILEEEQASISHLQRKLRIGHARAARIIDELEERGIVGGYEGSKPRKVLITKDNLDLSSWEE